mmetsp:Transcript_31473/g.61405  ORF Transcript_31473/g.61405 Transcript_31473/m.61405 type:complete len:309 (+) Transcript_31473:740-1666(+)
MPGDSQQSHVGVVPVSMIAVVNEDVDTQGDKNIQYSCLQDALELRVGVVQAVELERDQQEANRAGEHRIEGFGYTVKQNEKNQRCNKVAAGEDPDFAAVAGLLGSVLQRLPHLERVWGGFGGENKQQGAQRGQRAEEQCEPMRSAIQHRIHLWVLQKFKVDKCVSAADEVGGDASTVQLSSVLPRAAINHFKPQKIFHFGRVVALKGPVAKGAHYRKRTSCLHWKEQEVAVDVVGDVHLGTVVRGELQSSPRSVSERGYHSQRSGVFLVDEYFLAKCAEFALPRCSLRAGEVDVYGCDVVGGRRKRWR